MSNSHINRPDSIPGYEEPENAKPFTGGGKIITNINTSLNGIYKTFDENAKGKKKNEFKSVVLENSYMTNNIQEDENDICPVCSKPPVYKSYTVYNDRKCEDDHCWYIKRDGEIVIGKPK